MTCASGDSSINDTQFPVNGHAILAIMDIGWLDVCLRVKDVRASREFYEGLGFHRVEGDEAEGWAVVVSGEARIGLYEPKHMEGDGFCLNFRGGNVRAITDDLKNRSYAFAKELYESSEGGASARLKDPDGHTIFFDTAPGETKKT